MGIQMCICHKTVGSLAIKSLCTCKCWNYITSLCKTITGNVHCTFV